MLKLIQLRTTMSTLKTKIEKNKQNERYNLCKLENQQGLKSTTNMTEDIICAK